MYSYHPANYTAPDMQEVTYPRLVGTYYLFFAFLSASMSFGVLKHAQWYALIFPFAVSVVELIIGVVILWGTRGTLRKAQERAEREGSYTVQMRPLYRRASYGFLGLAALQALIAFYELFMFNSVFSVFQVFLGGFDLIFGLGLLAASFWAKPTATVPASTINLEARVAALEAEVKRLSALGDER